MSFKKSYAIAGWPQPKQKPAKRREVWIAPDRNMVKAYGGVFTATDLRARGWSPKDIAWLKNVRKRVSIINPRSGAETACRYYYPEKAVLAFERERERYHLI
jgi:hypothetical protein